MSKGPTRRDTLAALAATTALAAVACGDDSPPATPTPEPPPPPPVQQLPTPKPGPLAALVGAPARPNIVLVLADDLRIDKLGCFGGEARTPHLDRMAAEGVLFRNAFVNISLCSPSRATLLTGCLPQRNGVFGNEGLDPDPRIKLFPELLQAAGYRTGFVGKWHMATADAPRRGFDHWVSFSGQGTYTNPVINKNGARSTYTGHLEDLLADEAVAFLEGSATKAPFFLMLPHKAPHGPHVAPVRYANDYVGATLAEPPGYQDDLSGKPPYLRAHVVWGPTQADWDRKRDKIPLPDAVPPPPYPPRKAVKQVTGEYPEYLRLVTMLDDTTGRLRATLEKLGLFDQTVFVFASDNGMLQGEHQLFGIKQLAYEESIRIPMLMRVPWISTGREETRAATMVDVAPTLLDLAGVEAGLMDGVSLRPLLKGDDDPAWRTEHYYENFPDAERWPSRPLIRALRTPEWKLIVSPGPPEFVELYDLQNDKTEIKNLASDPAQAARLKDLRKRLDAHLKAAEASRPKPPPDVAAQKNPVPGAKGGKPPKSEGGGDD